MGPAALRYGSSAIPAACLALAAVGCAPEPVTTGFAETGELVALSGGDAGARGACHTCHGLQGEGDGNLTPRIAGLDSGYFARQLIFFADGQRREVVQASPRVESRPKDARRRTGRGDPADRVR